MERIFFELLKGRRCVCFVHIASHWLKTWREILKPISAQSVMTLTCFRASPLRRLHEYFVRVVIGAFVSLRLQLYFFISSLVSRSAVLRQVLREPV